MLDYLLNSKLYTDVNPIINKHSLGCIGSTHSNILIRTGRSVKTLLKSKFNEEISKLCARLSQHLELLGQQIKCFVRALTLLYWVHKLSYLKFHLL